MSRKKKSKAQHRVPTNRTMIPVPIEKWHKADAAFFEANPHRLYILRPVFPGEHDEATHILACRDLAGFATYPVRITGDTVPAMVEKYLATKLLVVGQGDVQ